MARANETMSASPREDVLGDLGALIRFDSTTGMRTASMMRAPPRQIRARHGLRDGGDARLVPADAGVKEVCARDLDRARHLLYLGRG
jgi:hypothetical protein